MAGERRRGGVGRTNVVITHYVSDHYYTHKTGDSTGGIAPKTDAELRYWENLVSPKNYQAPTLQRRHEDPPPTRPKGRASTRYDNSESRYNNSAPTRYVDPPSTSKGSRRRQPAEKNPDDGEDNPGYSYIRRDESLSYVSNPPSPRPNGNARSRNPVPTTSPKPLPTTQANGELPVTKAVERCSKCDELGPNKKCRPCEYKFNRAMEDSGLAAIETKMNVWNDDYFREYKKFPSSGEKRNQRLLLQKQTRESNRMVWKDWGRKDRPILGYGKTEGRAIFGTVAEWQAQRCELKVFDD